MRCLIPSLPHHWVLGLALGIAALCHSGSVIADPANPSEYERLQQTTRINVRNKIMPLLERYCGEACQIVDINVVVEEMIPDTEDLGFEGTSESKRSQTFYVERVETEIQIDKHVSQNSRERLQTIITNNLKNMGTSVQLTWTPIELPRIGKSVSEGEDLKQRVESKVTTSVNDVIRDYCPASCMLSHVRAQGKVLTSDEITGINPLEILQSSATNTYFHVEDIEVALSIDSELPATEREKILNVLKAKTSFVAPVRFNTNVTPFPESYSTKKARESAESADPYGLEKLKRMLILFRDLAGTKEIISSKEATSSMSSNNKDSTDTRSSSDSKIASTAENIKEYAVYILAFLVIAGIIAFIILRFSHAKQDANYMVHAFNHDQGGKGGENAEGSGEGGTRSGGEAKGKPPIPKDIGQYLRVADLKEELVNIFLDSPRVAKETFTRMLQDQGVEETAKYVHIFGKMIVFELLNDPNLSRTLYELSEFYHKSTFSFTIAEEERLLQNLKTQVTANEIRVLTGKTNEQFDFLLNLDAAQVFQLISDESSQVKSIVFTQLSPRNRRSVFNLFAGSNRVELMKELSKADAIPKEYLANVAKALHKKVMSKPQFDTQSLRSSDILLDLIERSTLKEQRSLMTRLVETNADAARAIKIKLVTLEMLPYLKDGLLLELVLGMEREDLLTFLAGTREHIRELLLSHAPRELSESWLEDLENVARIDDSKYRLVEITILNKIRLFASTGAINIMDINDMLFAETDDTKKTKDTHSDKQLPRERYIA